MSNLSKKEKETLRIIRNYLVHLGRAPTVRELKDKLGYKSPTSAALLINSLAEKEVLERNARGQIQLKKQAEALEGSAHTVYVPLVGTVACGTPIIAEENIEAFLPVSTELARPPHQYFMLRAMGDSMDRAGINNGDIVLVRQQSTAEPGDKVVALIDDEATIKEYRPGIGVIVLQPRSSKPEFKPIILTSEFRIQGIVTKTISGL
ncbi:MAG: transcriptional repressor LexA [Candidatus Margulisbacteria bacterium]|nr:transcriptional repressor LexA [Candidatus Margulisiibacteriota bacterium]